MPDDLTPAQIEELRATLDQALEALRSGDQEAIIVPWVEPMWEPIGPNLYGPGFTGRRWLAEHDHGG